MLEQHNSSMLVAWCFDANNSVAISDYECIKKIQACAGFKYNSLVPISLQASERGERMQHSDLAET